MTHEGVLIWERQHFTDRVTRKRILVCFVAAVGETVNHSESAFYLNPHVVKMGSTAEVVHSDSMDTHARQLIFDFLQDIGRFWGSPGTHLDLHVLLEDVYGGGRQVWQMTWEELQECVYGDRYDFMVETEARAPSYFFEQNAATKGSLDSPREFVTYLLRQGEYDGMVFVLIGSTDHLFDLVPSDVHRRRLRDRGSDAVKLVRLSNWPHHVDVALANGFGERKLHGDFQFTSDVDLRYSLLEAVFGATRLDQGRELANKA